MPASFGSRASPSGPSTHRAVAHPSAIMHVGATTVAEGEALAGQPVDGSMMWLYRTPLMRL